jgi:hypothetical protein
MLESPATRRRAGFGLVAFGLTGLVLILAAGALIFGSLAAVSDAATGFERQRTEIRAMVGPASDVLERAATSASNAGTSLSTTSEAATRAASLTTNLADSFERLAAATTFEILGTRPFAELEGQFNAVASDARTLSRDLTAASSALEANVTDSAAVATDLRALARQLDSLEASLGGDEGAGTSATSSLPIDAARIVLAGLLVWLAIPAIGSIWLGWRLARPTDT